MSILHRVKLPLAAAALASVGFLGVAAADVGAEMAPPTQAACTTPLTLRSIELVRTTNGPAILVSGIKPHDDTRVVLLAEDVEYVQAPAYWNYSIVGCGGTGPVRKVAFTEVLSIDGPRGIYGIAIGGRRFDLGTASGPATS